MSDVHKLNSVVLILSGRTRRLTRTTNHSENQGCSQPSYFATVALDESPQAEIELMFDQYIDTFSQAKWEAVDDFWHTPGWFAKGSESIHLADDVAVQTFYRDLLQQLRQDGYSHSDLLDSELSSSMPLARCFVFRTPVGAVMEKSCRLS